MSDARAGPYYTWSGYYGDCLYIKTISFGMQPCLSQHLCEAFPKFAITLIDNYYHLH